MVRTRFAPSPTGFLHIGGLRTALYAYLLAKCNKGNFVLRIEDTDQKRQIPGAVDALKETLNKFGLVYDEFYIQSQRLEKYKDAAKKLVDEGKAFYCDCGPKNAKVEGFSKELRDPCRQKKLKTGAIKLKVPDGQLLKYFDFVHKKEISWKSDLVYDATLLKSDGYPTYHLAVAVDDLDMKITHILRGHDWLPSTPIHLLVFSYLGGKRPEIGHLTDILSSETGKKLSKRRDSVFIEDYLKDGYLPEAILNFVLLLGWAPKDNKELFTLNEMIEVFDIDGFQEANPKFFIDKLNWFNGYYIRQLSPLTLAQKLATINSEFAEMDENLKLKIVNLIQERIKTLKEFNVFAGFFFTRPKVDLNLFGKNYQIHLSAAIEALEKGISLDKVPQNYGFKAGDFFMDLRIAITGSRFTPPINESIVILGKEEAIYRLRKPL